MNPLVSVSNLRYRYEDGTLALDGVNFELFAGETVILFGANGSGKTTFVHHLNGLFRGEGQVSVCGLTVERANLAAIRTRVGLVFQDPDDQLFMSSVLEDVAFGPLNLGHPPPHALTLAKEALERAGMLHALDKAPHRLSAGEKRRVAIAGVLGMQPEILVLDEPTTFLDPPGQHDLLALLRRLPQAKIIATHEAGFARAIGTRAVFFDQGRIIRSGPVEDVIREFGWEPK
ncbi:MAG: ABC transporter ATP-binding protein [Acidobacteria bacterium]|nr:ABC transporter ATP-binding protein [Acidobacteriota bacterium]MBI3281847.1 ABC transporter ATP-binding protein [Acidobacteriota bacterium]